MTRDDERFERATQPPNVVGLPDAPGITAAMALSPDLGVHLRGLADALLVDDFPGATLCRAEREMIATVTSAGNDCFYCMDSHAAFATELQSAVATLVARYHHDDGRPHRLTVSSYPRPEELS